MIFLFILFFNTNFALSNEVINNYKNEDNNPKKSQIKTILETNYSFSRGETLKDIPKTMVSDSEKKELRARNPFSPPGSEGLNSKSGINFSDISFKGLAKIGNNQVAFMEQRKELKHMNLTRILGEVTRFQILMKKI